MHTSAPAVVGEWVLEAVLGAGGMGKVWRGVHCVTGEAAAVKVMSGQPALGLSFARAFRNEVEAVARLHHPGVVHIFDFGEISGADAERSGGLLAAGHPYLVMELAAAGKLSRRDPQRSWHELKRVLLALLDALAHAHARGVIHRDVKPANVLFAPGNPPTLKLTDFGLAHARRDGQQLGDDILAASGTPPYMAPEQFDGDWRSQGPWTDLYAVGCLAYTLAMGAPPFRGSDMHTLAACHLWSPPPALASAVPLPQSFPEWVYMLLAKHPSDRFRCAADARHALASLEEDDLLPPSSVAPAAQVPDSETLQLAALAPASARPRRAGVRHEPPPPLADWRADDAFCVTPGRARAGLALFGLREAPLVGREAERDHLWACLRDVHHDRRTRSVVLRGSAGAGKSRLARWLAQRADELGSAVVMSASHGPQGGSHDGVTPMLLRHLRAQDLDRADLALRLDAALVALGDRARELRPGLLELFLPEHSADLIEHGHGADEVVLRLLRLCCHERPLLLLVDDAQWGLDALRLVRRLHASAEPLPVLALVTVRDGELAERPLERAELDALLAEARNTTLPLSPLGAVEQRDLVAQLLGLRADLVDHVVARTGGNPLFAVQLVGDWVARGVLRAGGEGLALPAGEEAALPADLRALCQSRITQAVAGRARDDGRAIELAALLGAEFDELEWSAACAAASLQPSASLLGDLTRQGLLERGFGAFRFAHGVIREVIELGALGAGRFARHHHAIASMLRRRQRRASASFCIRIARHFRAAGELHDAHGPLLSAARLLRVDGDLDRAVETLRERREVLDGLEVPAVDPLRAEGDLCAAQLLIGRGEREPARELALGVAADARARGWPALEARALLRLGEVAAAHDDYLEARRLYQLALASLTTFGDQRGVFEARQGLAEADYYLGDMDRCAEVYRQNLALAQRLDDALAMAETEWGLGYVAIARGDLALATERFERMRKHLEGRGATYRMAECRAALGEVARRAHRYEEAEQHYWDAVKIGSAGASTDAVCRVNVAMSLLARGEPALALEVAEYVAAAARPDRFPRALSAALTVLAASHAQLGHFAECGETLVEFEQRFGASGLRDDDDADHLELSADCCAGGGHHELADHARRLSAAVRPSPLSRPSHAPR